MAPLDMVCSHIALVEFLLSEIGHTKAKWDGVYTVVSTLINLVSFVCFCNLVVVS